MKERNKKIIKGIGVGTLACVGVLGLTGCSKVEVSQDKVDNMIETVEKVDNKLDEYVNLLEQQKQELQDQNEELQKVNDALNEQKELLEEANRLTKEEVWNLAKRADFNLKMNVNGLRDNLVFESVVDNTQYKMAYYNSEDLKVYAQFDGSEVYCFYQETDGNVYDAIIEKVEDQNVCTYVYDNGKDDSFEYITRLYDSNIPSIESYDCTYEDLNHYEILDNGNVKLTFVKNVIEYEDEDDQTSPYRWVMEIVELEYSIDAKIVAGSYKTVLMHEDEDYSGYSDLDDVAFVANYGAVDVEMVESWVELANGKEALEEECLALADVADSKIYNNIHAVFTSVFDGEESEGVAKYFVNNSISAALIDGEEGIQFAYQIGDAEVCGAELSEGQNGYVCDSVSETGTTEFDEYISAFGQIHETREYYELDDYDLRYCRKLSNGNVELVYEQNYSDMIITYSFEYSQNKDLVSTKQNIYAPVDEDVDSDWVEIFTMVTTYEYDTVELDEMQDLVELAEAKRNEQ